jgi:hypothetical protein
MKLTTTTILLMGGAILLIWSGITDRNPVDVLKSIFTGNELPETGSWTGGKMGRFAPPRGNGDSGGGGGSSNQVLV